MSEYERITVSLSAKSVEALNFLTAAGSGSTKTDAINKALQLFAEVRKLQNEDGAIYFREPGGTELQRVRIF